MTALSLALAYLGTIGLVAFYLWLMNARAERSVRAAWLAELQATQAKQADATRALLVLEGRGDRADALEKRVADLEKLAALRRTA